MAQRLIFLVIAVALVASPSWATTYYVDATIAPASCGTYSIANRDCSGSDGTAYKTAAGGIAVLAADDVLSIRAGTYSTTLVWSNKSGTSGHPITIRPYNTETVTFQPSSGRNGAENSSWVNIGAIVFDCVNVPGGNGDCLDLELNDDLTNTVHDEILDGFTVKNSGRANGGYNINPGVAANSGITGNLLNITFQNCFVFNNGNNVLDHGFYVMGSHVIIDNCTVYHNSGQGIQRYDGSGTALCDHFTVKNSTFYDNGQSTEGGAGILLVSNTSEGGDIVYNNVTYGNHGGIITVGNGATTTVVYNNTSYNDDPVGIQGNWPGTSSNSICKNNLVIGSSTPIEGCSESNNITTGTAASHFVDVGAGNFHLSTNSAARDAGATLALFSTDIEGNSRPSGSAWDVGAYEYDAGGETTPVFAYYSPFVIDHTKVQSADQTDFPILIDITDTRLKSIANGGHVFRTDGFDIRPYSNTDLANGNRLTYRDISYDPTTGHLRMRVKIPTLHTGSDDTVYLAYNSSSFNSSGESANTYSNSYAAYYQFINSSGTLVAHDDGPYFFDGTISGATATAGQVADAALFNGTSAYIDAGANTNLNSLAAVTVCSWIYRTSSNIYQHMVEKADGVNGFVMQTNNAGDLIGLIRSSGTVGFVTTTDTPLTASTWKHACIVYDGALTGNQNRMKLYIDGTVSAAVSDTGTVGASYGIPTSNVIMGRPLSDPGDSYYGGRLDEVSLATVARTANWIKTAYNNESSPDSFGALGTEVNVSGTPITHGIFRPGIFTPSVIRAAQ